MQLRKAKELVVETDDHVAEPRASRDPDHHAQRADDECPLQVVPPDRQVAVSKCLQRGDLGPLQRQRTRERDIQDEGRDQEEDERQHEAEALKLGQLVLDRPVGQLEGPWNRAQAAIRFEHAVEPCNRLVRGEAGAQSQHDVIESAFHVERRAKRLTVHPEDAEPLVVGNELAWTDAVDELWRQRDAHDLEPAEPAVDHRRHLIAGIEPVCDREALAGEDFVAVPRFDPASAAEEQVVHAGTPVRGNRDQAAGRRLLELLEDRA